MQLVVLVKDRDFHAIALGFNPTLPNFRGEASISAPDLRYGRAFSRLMTRSQDATYLMEYYWETMEQMVDPDHVLNLLEKAGFQEVQRHVVLGIFSEYTARKP